MLGTIDDFAGEIFVATLVLTSLVGGAFYLRAMSRSSRMRPTTRDWLWAWAIILGFPCLFAFAISPTSARPGFSGAQKATRIVLTALSIPYLVWISILFHRIPYYIARKRKALARESIRASLWWIYWLYWGILAIKLVHGEDANSRLMHGRTVADEFPPEFLLVPAPLFIWWLAEWIRAFGRKEAGAP